MSAAATLRRSPSGRSLGLRGQTLLVAALVAAALAGPARAQQPAATTSVQTGGDPAPDTASAVDLVQKGRYEDAIIASKRALSHDDRYVPAMMQMAKSYYYLKKYELATAIIDIAKTIDPNNAEGFNLLGFIALTRDDRISATAAFRKATELKPDYVAAWNNLSAQYLFSKNYDGALEASEKATQLAPAFAKGWLNLGSAYRGKQRYEDAEKAYRKALELNPKYPEAYFDLGILYLDAPQMPNQDVATKLNTGISHLTKYKELASYRLTKDDPADSYMDDARKAIDREKKRLERAAKQKEAKKPAPASPGEAPAAVPGGQP